MNKPVKILIVEDSEDDAMLALRALRQGGFDPTHRRVQTAKELETALVEERWDAVISDFRMPGFTGVDALGIFRATGLDIPFILISGTIGEATAVAAMKAGASDYMMKQSLARLAPVLERELKETQMRAAHRQAQRELVQSEQRLRTIIEAEPECVHVMSKEGLLLEMNAAGLAMLEADSLAAVQSRPLLDFVVPEYRAAFTALFKRVIRGDKGILEYEVIGLKGGRRWLETHAAPMSGANGEGALLLAVTRDITERKKSQDKIVYLNRVYAMLSGINTLIVHARNRDELYREACRIAVEAGGFRMAWIGIVDRSVMKIVPVASAGADEEILTAIKDRFSLSEDAHLGNTMAARAIREKKFIVSNDLQSNPQAVFRKKYVEFGIRSVAILPLMVADEAVGVLALYAGELDFFHEEELNLLTGLAGDIAFALHNIGKEEKIARLSRIQAFMSGINSTIVRVRERAELFNETCRIAVEHGHFALSWIGTFDPATQDVTPAAWAGEHSEALTTGKSSARDDTVQGKGAVGRAIRERRPVFNNDVAAHPFGGPRLKEILRMGCRSLISLPLFDDHTVVATLTMYATEQNFFDEEEVRLLTELAGNVSFALGNIRSEEKIARLNRIQALMSGINAVIVRVRDSPELFNEACRIAVEHGGFAMSWIGTFDPVTQDVTPVAWSGESSEMLTRAKSSARDDIPEGAGAVGRAIRARRPIFNNEIGANTFGGPRAKEILRLGFRSQITLPLLDEQTIVGTFTMYTREQGYFDEEELRLLTELAGNISFAVAHISRAEKIARLNRIQAVMSGINAAIVHIHDREALFTEACRIAVEQGGFGIAWIGLLNPRTLAIAPVACAGLEAESLVAHSQNTAQPDVPQSQSVVSRAIREKRTVFSNDITVEPGAGGERRKEAIRRGYRSGISLPLLVEGAAVGSLSLYASERNFFNADELTLLNVLAGDISFALENFSKEEKIVRLNRIQAVTSGINAVIVRVHNRQELFDEACRVAVEDGKFGTAWVGVLDAAAREISPVAWAGVRLDPDGVSTRTDVATGRGVIAHAIREKRPVFDNDISSPSSVGGERQARALQHGYRSLAALPFIVENAAVGQLSLYTKDPDFFNKDELNLLSELASNISLALENFSKEEKIVRLNRIQAVMSGINAVIVHVGHRQSLLNEACRIAVEQGGFGVAWIGMLNPDTLEITPAAWAGVEAEALLAHVQSSARPDLPGGRGVIGRAMREKRAVFSNDLAAEPETGGGRRIEALRRGYCSTISLPLLVEGAAVGNLSLFARERNFFDTAELNLLTNLAGNIAFALENINQQQKLDKLARIRSISSEVNAAIVRIHDRAALLRETCRIANTHGEFELVWIAEIDQVKQKVQAVAWAGFSPEAAHALDWSRINAAQGTLGKAILTGKPAVRNDVGVALPVGKLRQEAALKGCRSTVSLPLVIDGNVVALIGLFAPEAGFFDDEELALLAEVAGNISFALGHIEKEQKIVRLSRIQSVMSGINTAIVRVRDQQQLFGETCRIAVEQGGFGIAWIGMLDPMTLENIPTASAGVDADSLSATSRNTAPSDISMVGRAIRERRPVFSNELAAEASPGGARRQEALRRGYHSLVVLPLIVENNAVGSLSLFAKEPDFFTDEEIGLLTELAANVSFALDHIRKRKALADSEKKLDGILGRLQEVVWSMDPRSGQILYINAAVEQITRRPAADFLAQPGLWKSMVHRDDSAPMRRAVRRLLHEGTLVHEFRIVLADGEIRTVESRSRVRSDEAKKVMHVDGTISDITERTQIEGRLQESEQLMRAAFENAAVGIVHAGLDGSYQRVNAKFCALLGYTREELETMNTRDTNHPDERDQLGVANRLLLAGEVKEYSSEKRYLRKDGSAVWAKRTVSLVKDAAGAPLYFIRIVEDITERKQAEDALRLLNEELEGKVTARTADLQRAQHEAEDANQAKSSFLAAMSHEIRTPMNGVIGMIDVLHQSSLKGDQVEMVDLIRESAFSLLGIINDILDFSKIEAGKLELEREAFAVGDVVEGVCSMLNGMADKKDVALILYTDPAIPAQVLGDGLRLRQVLVNLINNAIKFSSGQLQMGRVSVRALLVEQSTEKVIVEIRVTDNGIGMNDETQARLFTAFTQADVSTTRHFGGTGLGLAIANSMVELMGGEITVQSAPREGATFKVRLPFALLPGNANTVEVASEVAGLCCVVVGEAEGLADDLAAYLKHAHADVKRAPDLASARAQRADRSGLSVWVVDAGNEPQSPEHIRAAAHAEASQDVRFVVVLIERGKRRRPRVVAPDMITVDGNALNRRTFLRAVAVAAGRASLEVEEVKSAFGKLAAIAPSRVEALRQGRLILIAEDNETNQKVILRQLALLGYTADIATDGREALELWKNGDYALLLTDLHMPRMDGYELTQAIRAEEKGERRIPIIALTANALKGEAAHCRVVGMDDYRSKPSPLAELKSVLEKWLPSTGPSTDVILATPLTAAVQQIATAVPVDVSVLEGLVGDDPALVREFLEDFRSSAGKITLELRAACATGHTAAVVAAAHKLKSSARAVGAFALGELCAAMEEEGKAGDSDALNVLLPRFETEMALVDDYLDKQIENAPSGVI